MQTVTVAAIKSFSFEGRDVIPGESVTLSPLDASILGRRGFVSLLYGDVGIQRKDMTAETPAGTDGDIGWNIREGAEGPAGQGVCRFPPETPPETTEAPVKKTRKRSGRYARRDMRAEGGE